MIHTNEVVEAARTWVGTPYRHQCQTKDIGCDCLGLVAGVYQQLFGAKKLDIPPYSANWRDKSYEQDLLQIADRYFVEDLDIYRQPGRIVLFQMAVGYPLKHCGIVSCSDQFIHAQERVGVVEVPLSSWWKRRIRKSYQFREIAE